jgi:hypothetical protein
LPYESDEPLEKDERRSAIGHPIGRVPISTTLR